MAIDLGMGCLTVDRYAGLVHVLGDEVCPSLAGSLLAVRPLHGFAQDIDPLVAATAGILSALVEVEVEVLRVDAQDHLPGGVRTSR